MSYFTKAPAARPQAVSGFFDDLWTGVKDAGKGALTFYGNQKHLEGQVAAQQGGQATAPANDGMGLLLPVAVVGLGVGAFFLLRKKK